MSQPVFSGSAPTASRLYGYSNERAPPPRWRSGRNSYVSSNYSNFPRQNTLCWLLGKVFPGGDTKKTLVRDGFSLECLWSGSTCRRQTANISSRRRLLLADRYRYIEGVGVFVFWGLSRSIIQIGGLCCCGVLRGEDFLGVSNLRNFYAS